ncbi:hypothetical protein PVT67_00285 [Gallaecimonas kandeliae]|uniref:hypothetical protein n=1 Tax=Gallaecimonas kandeliae TaxID=3029055 RepID=UPI0026476F9C|nr:hypothetical protein [Gallaecimonas kandeliae]WKE65729.1 hypothetical protein PVT67_00285 [Gallaecimonas kandeliae]
MIFKKEKDDFVVDIETKNGKQLGKEEAIGFAKSLLKLYKEGKKIWVVRRYPLCPFCNQLVSGCSFSENAILESHIPIQCGNKRYLIPSIAVHYADCHEITLEKGVYEELSAIFQ